MVDSGCLEVASYDRWRPLPPSKTEPAINTVRDKPLQQQQPLPDDSALSIGDFFLLI